MIQLVILRRLHCISTKRLSIDWLFDRHDTLQETARPFNTIYVSFYKGLGALSGAMLLGDTEFCAKARVWLRRMGGNLYTLLPYAVSSWDGFRKNCLSSVNDGDGDGGGGDGIIADDRKWRYDRQIFERRRQKLSNIMEMLKGNGNIESIVSFDPVTPQTNMVHGYLQVSLEQCMEAIDKVETNTGIRVLNRVNSCSDESNSGNITTCRCRFELTVGEANVLIDDAHYLLGWQEFSNVIEKMKEND